MKLRKTKKAFKKGIKNYDYDRYFKHLLAIEQRKRLAIKTVMAATISAVGAFRVNMIRSCIGMNPIEKSLSMITAVIDTAQAMNKVFAKEL